MSKVRTRKKGAERPGDDSGDAEKEAALEALEAAQERLRNVGVSTLCLMYEPDPINGEAGMQCIWKGCDVVIRHGLLSYAMQQEVNNWE